MATISTGTVTHILDQSSGLQDDDVALSTDLNQLPDPFEAFLNAVPAPLQGLSQVQRTYAADVKAAQETALASTFFVNVQAESGETINDLFFSQDNGQLFTGQVAQFGGEDIHVVGSTEEIHLYSFAAGDILIGSTEAPADVDITDPTTLDRSKIVFAYYLQENATHTGADVWGVTFQPLDHPLAGDTVAAHDDAIDFGDFLHVTASASLSFNFDELPSGANLFGVVGTSDEDPAIIVIGENIDLLPANNKGDIKYSNVSDTIHTSQGGTGATIGVNNQLFDNVSEGAYFTYVNNPVEDFLSGAPGGLNSTEADFANNIQYTGGTLQVDGAFFAISQMQGNNLADVKISAFLMGNDFQEVDFVDNLGNNLGNGTDVDITTIRVFSPADLDTPLLETSVDVPVPVNGLTVDFEEINGQRVVTIFGLDDSYKVEWDTDGLHDQVLIEQVGGQFDIGQFGISRGALETENIGDAVIIQDDGPRIGPIANSIVDFSVGATSGSVPLAGAPGTDDDSTYTITDFTEQFVVNGVTVNGVLSADKGTVEYFGDDDGTPGPSAGDTKYYTLDLGTTDPGDYTFTVHFAPPAPPLVFDFDDLPSGANLFGVVGTSATDPAIIVIGEEIDLKGGNKYSNISDTIHTSQGGTGATIGVNNQLFDEASEGAYFTYVNDPDANYLSGVPGGLTATEADDANNIQYDGETLPVDSAFFAISQMQGNDLADVKISAFLMGDNFQEVDFVDNLGNNLGNGTDVDITTIRVFSPADLDTPLLETSVDVPVPVNGLTVDFEEINGQTVVSIFGLDDSYRVEWDTLGLHDQVLIEHVGGQFDIGQFGISQPQETDDQELDFTVQIEEGDEDTATASFSIGIDGNHDGDVLNV